MNIKRLLLVPALMFAVAAPALAYDADFNVEANVKKMKVELGLTDTQAEQIKPIIQDYKNNIERAHDEKQERLNAVLNNDQQGRLKANMKDKKHDDKD